MENSQNTASPLAGWTHKSELIHRALEKAARWLSPQGPLDVFIAQNTLQNFEDLRFEDAVEMAHDVLGAEPYWSLDAYTDAFREGRITVQDIRTVLGPRDIPLELLFVAEKEVSEAAFQWLVQKERGLWKAVSERGLNSRPSGQSLMMRDTRRLNRRFIPLCLAYLDQGLSHWRMPERERGFLFAATQGRERNAEEVIVSALGRLAIAETEWYDFIQSEILALPGWAGMFSVLERRPDLKKKGGPVSLLEYLAVRLWLARPDDYQVSRAVARDERSREWQMVQLLTRMKIHESELGGISPEKWQAWTEAIEGISEIERRRYLAQALERNYGQRLLATLSSAKRSNEILEPEYHVFTCLDEREESFRRHLESTNPRAVTYGVAGFFGVDMAFQGWIDGEPANFCPGIVTPKVQVREVLKSQPNLPRRGLVERIARDVYRASRGVITGLVYGLVAGIFAAIPLSLRLLCPRVFGRLWKWVSTAWLPPVETEFVIERNEEAGSALEGLLQGYTLNEMADRVGGILRTIGLVKNFSPCVFVLGHGSTSLNNPHKSAYDCGACGGRPGYNNARAFCVMANHPGVRLELARRGISIPEKTRFVAGYHDTATDEVRFFDLPGEQWRSCLEKATSDLQAAAAASAMERARHFVERRKLSPKTVMNFVRARTEDLREARPEYGHCTNAACIVGPRESTRSLNFDRRAFLVSYETELDPEGSTLKNIFDAPLMVCAGINLNYYFSLVDTEKYGSGSKLPHNVAGLIGVMNGGLGDLRTGLPIQGVELHQAQRLWAVFYTSKEKFEAAYEHSVLGSRVIKNGWVFTAVIDERTGTTYVWQGGGLIPWQGDNHGLA